MAAWSDLRYSARSLTRAPGFAVALWLTIALGIGANASVRGFIRGSVDRGLPLSDVEGAVSLFARGSGDTFGPVSYDDYLLLKAQLSELELLGAVRELHRHVDIDGRSSIMAVAAVTREVAELLNLSLGDGVVVSDRVRRSELYRKARVHGEPVRIDGIDTRVAGVAPDWLEGLYADRPVDIWTTLPEESLRDSDRGSRTFWALGRLRPGVSVEDAQAAVSARRSAADAIAVLPYTGIAPEVAGGMARIGRLLPVAAGAVFLIACTNIVAFLLARASARSHETSVRVALGASLWQLGRQLLSDSALITVVGGAVGVLLAYWTAHVIPALFFEQDAERLVFSPDVAGIIAASAACAGITIACGLTPLVETRHDDPAAVLQRGGTGVSRAQRRVRSGLAVSQMACCSVLVISTALLFAAFRAALRTGAGNRLGRPILATLQTSRGFDRPDLGLTYFRNAEQAVQSLPGVSATAWVGTLPGGRPMWSAIRAEPPHLPRREVMLDVALFTPRSLALVHLPPVAGRMFGGADTIHSCRVVVVNEEAAQALFDGDAVGRSIEDPAGEHAEIIGVVRTRRRARTDAPSRPTVYYYAEQIGTPLDRTGPATFQVPRLPTPPGGVIDTNVVSPNYFEAVGLPVVAGRVFAGGPGSGCRVGVVNQEAAELYFGGDAVGGALIDGAGRRTEIIGVVRSPLFRTSQRRADPAIYLPMEQDFVARMSLILGTQDPSDTLLTSTRSLLAGVPDGVLVSVTTLDEHLSRTVLAPERIATVLVGACAAMALALGGLGIYGAMADFVRQRRREIAMRFALGAQRWRVIGRVIAEGLRLAGVGTVAGILGSLLVARWLTGMTPDAGSVTIWAWLAAPIALVAAVAFASVLPARRALSVDPLTIMRDT